MQLAGISVLSFLFYTHMHESRHIINFLKYNQKCVLISLGEKTPYVTRRVNKRSFFLFTASHKGLVIMFRQCSSLWLFHIK